MIDELHRHLYVKASARKATLREQQVTISSNSSDTQNTTTSPPMTRKQTGCEYDIIHHIQWNLSNLDIIGGGGGGGGGVD